MMNKKAPSPTTIHTHNGNPSLTTLSVRPPVTHKYHTYTTVN